MDHQELFEEIRQKQFRQEIKKEAKKDLEDLMRGNSKADIVKLYNKANAEIKGRKGRLHKWPFFIYWLSLKTRNSKWEDIDSILEEIWDENPELVPTRDPYGISFKYSKKIRSRHKERPQITSALAKLAIEQAPRSDQYLNLLKSLESHLTSQPLPDDFERIFLSLLKASKDHPEFKKVLESAVSTRPGRDTVVEILKRLRWIDRESKFKLKLLDYLAQRKKVSLREIQRKFSKRKSEIMPSLRLLEKEDIISLQGNSGVFLNE